MPIREKVGEQGELTPHYFAAMFGASKIHPPPEDLEKYGRIFFKNCCKKRDKALDCAWPQRGAGRNVERRSP